MAVKRSECNETRVPVCLLSLELFEIPISRQLSHLSSIFRFIVTCKAMSDKAKSSSTKLDLTSISTGNNCNNWNNTETGITRSQLQANSNNPEGIASTTHVNINIYATLFTILSTDYTRFDLSQIRVVIPRNLPRTSSNWNWWCKILKRYLVVLSTDYTGCRSKSRRKPKSSVTARTNH